MIMKTQQTHPVFILKALFDFLKINIIQCMTMKPRIEFLNLKRNEIEKLNMYARIYQEGMFLETFRYVQFSMDDEILLCVFGTTDRCFRAYSYKEVALN
jgi:hypothetical protein